MWLAFLVTLGISHNTRAAISARHRDYLIHHWTTDDGLPQNRVTAIAQTGDGYLWLGSWFGISRFDGLHFQLFSRHNTPGLLDEAVAALAVPSDGLLYVAHRRGLNRLRGDRFEEVPLEGIAPGTAVWDLAKDGSGRLWVDTMETIGPVDGNAFTDVRSGRSRMDPTRQKLLSLGSLGMAAILKNGIGSLTGTNAAVLSDMPPELRRDNRIRSVVAGANGSLWVAAVEGLYHKPSAGNWQLLWKPQKPPDFIELLFLDAEGTLWAGIRSRGLFRWNRETFEPLELTHTPFQPDVLAFHQDPYGSVWIGTTEGLFQLRPRFIRSISIEEGLPHKAVVSVTEAPDGSIWAATELGAARIPPNEFRAIPAADPNAGRRAIVSDASNTLWMDLWAGSGVGALRQAAGPMVPLMTEPGIESLYVDHENRLWVGIPGGVRCYRDGHLLSLSNLPTCEVRATLQVRDGSMWFGTWGQGAFHWKDGKLLNVSREQGLSDDRVVALHEDADGILWMGTHHGLNRVQWKEGARTVHSLTAADGLLDDIINHLVEDSEGAFWISCNRGLFRVDRAQLNGVAQGRARRVMCAIFSSHDGMPSSETNGERQPAGVKGADGRLWFPTTGGLSVIDPDATPLHGKPPVTVLESVSIDGKPCSLAPESGRVTLPPGSGQVLVFRYTLPTFMNPERALFRHRLRGLKEEWMEAGEQRVAYFTNLKPGNYTFEVQGANAFGAWSEEPVRYALQIQPRFDQTLWYPISWTAVALTLIAGGVLWRLRWQRTSHQVTQALKIEHERARIAADLHDELGSRLTALALRSRGTPLEAELRNAAERLRELVWAVDPKCDSLEGLVGFLVDESERLLFGAGISLNLKVPSPIPARQLGTETRRQLALVAQEALTNAVRHSQATVITLELVVVGSLIHIRIGDDGIGNVTAREGGRGLKTMRARMESLGGQLQILSGPHIQGTRVEAIYSIPPNELPSHD